jgi:ABC-type uncharacterized transport system permease subunit
MASLLTVGNWLLPLLYLALLIDYGATFFLRQRIESRGHPARLVAVLGPAGGLTLGDPWLVGVIVVHAGLLVLRSIATGRPPQADAQEVLSVVALAVAIVYCLVEVAAGDRRSGVFVLSLAFLLQYTSSFLMAGEAGKTPPAAGPESAWAYVHSLTALVAYVALAFAAVYGLLYVLARRGLRHHHFGVLFDRLPPLELLGRMIWPALVIGFIFMTAVILTGPLMFAAAGDNAPSPMANPKILAKVVTGSLAWVVYVAAILGRLVGKWQPGRVAGAAILGYVAVLALAASSALL